MDKGTLDIVGDTTIFTDLHYPSVLGKGGMPRKRILFVLGGGKAGVVTAERLHVLAEAGIPADHFDLIVGISAGAFNALAYGSRQTELLRGMYLFFCNMPFAVWDQVYELICEMEQRFDRKRFDTCTSEILIGVSDHASKLSLHSAKETPNLFGLLYTAAAIPPFSFGRHPDGSQAFDGAFAHPCPIRETVRAMQKKWDARSEIDIVLLANRPRPEHLPLSDAWMFWWGVNVFLRMWAPHLCEGANTIDTKVTAVIPVFEKRRPQSRFRTCAWFPSRDQYISPVEWNLLSITGVAEAVRGETEAFVNAQRPQQWV